MQEMKRTAINHPKIGRLSRALDIDEAYAIGILESVWHFTAKNAPAGNVGKWGDDEIVAAASKLPSAAVIAALVSAGWLDQHDEHRLIVHDWHEHCEDQVHMTLARAGKYFADGQLPKLSRLPQKERKAIEAAYQSLESTRNTHKSTRHTHKNARKLTALPSPAKPCQAKPCQAPALPEGGANDVGANGNGRKKPGAGIFKNISTEMLRDDVALLEWYQRATGQSKPVIHNCEANLIRVFGAAVRALELGDKPPALFASIVSGAKWDLISTAQEDRAVARLKAAQRPTVDSKQKPIARDTDSETASSRASELAKLSACADGRPP
jgi:hypothetical protein